MTIDGRTVPMSACDELEAMIVRNLMLRGLPRVPNRLAFIYAGEAVELTIEQSVYSGYFIVVRHSQQKLRQFRARAGAYDWNEIAAFIVETAERRRGVVRAASVREQNERLARDLASAIGAGLGVPASISPSREPGRVLVALPEVELDPVSVMRLFELVRNALPAASREPDAPSMI
jgi:hypothetical protein